MRAILHYYRYINILSVDIVAGAVISALFFAKIFQVQVRTFGLLTLALTVWVIYTADHLRDAKKIKHPASTERHRFHQRNFRKLTIYLFLALLLDCIMLFFIRKQVFEWGLVLSIGVFFYLIIHQALRFLKELFIAALYTCGVLILSISTTDVELNLVHNLLVLQFAFIAWINLLLFSWFDQQYDQRDEQHSFVTVLGGRTTVTVLYGLWMFNYLLTIAQIILSTVTPPVIILFIMNTGLFLIFIFRKSVQQNDVYRLLGDAVFIVPVFYLL
jgi:hypothetical protein